jgi:hypothetical protein
MEDIFKFCILGKGGEVKEIIVFSREFSEDQPESPFNEKELAFIESRQIPVKFSKQAIYKDDSIFTIKHKFLKELKEPSSYHELYLFSHIQKFHLQTILENVLGKTGTISIDEYKQLLVNLNVTSSILRELETDKSSFTFEDMKEVTELMHDKTRFYKIPIGKRFRTIHQELFSANPFDMLSIPGKDIIWTQSSTNPIESFEYQLLLNNYGGRFLDNTMYVCFAEDVLDYCILKDIFVWDIYLLNKWTYFHSSNSC